MSIEGIISIIIAVLWIGVGIPSLVVAISRKKYPKRMEFYVLDLVRIISPYVRKYDSIKLLHEGKETKNVSFIKGMCVCSGDEDIVLKSNMQKGGMQVQLPAEYKWLEVHVQESSEGLEVGAEIDEDAPNVLNICSELFKRDEVFTFDAYIEGGKDSRLDLNEIKVNHRINGAEKVEPKYVRLYRGDYKKKSLWSLAIMYIAMMTAMTVFTFRTVYDQPMRYVDKNNLEKVYSATIINQDTVSVSEGAGGVLPWRSEQYTIDEFKAKFEINIKQRTISHSLMISMMVVYIVFVLCIVGSVVYIRHRINKDKKVVDTYYKVTKKESEKDRNIEQK